MGRPATAQPLPAGCTPGTAADGGLAACELAAPGILDPIFSTADNFTLTIGSDTVPTTVQSGGVGFDDFAVELTGGGNQTLNLLGGGSLLEGIESAGGVRIGSTAGGTLRLLSEGSIVGGPVFGTGVSLLPNGANVDIDVAGVVAGGSAILTESLAQDASITATGTIEAGQAGVNVTGLGNFDVDVESVTSGGSAVVLITEGDVQLDATGLLNTPGNLPAVTINSGGVVSVSTRDIVSNNQALAVASAGGVTALIDGDATSPLASGSGAIEIRNPVAGDVDLTVTGDINRAIDGESTPGIVDVVQAAEGGAVTLDLGSVTSSGGVGTDDRDLVSVEVTAARAGDVTVRASGPLTHTGDASVDGIDIFTTASGNTTVDVQDISVNEIAISVLNAGVASGPFGVTNISAGNLAGSTGVEFIQAAVGGAVNVTVESIDFDVFGATFSFVNNQGGDSVFTFTDAITSRDAGGVGFSLNALNTGGDIVIDVNDVTAGTAVTATGNTDALRVTTRGRVLSTSTTPGIGGVVSNFGVSATNNGGGVTVDVLAGSSVEAVQGTAVQLDAADTAFTAVLTNAGTILSPNAAVVDLAGNSQVLNSGLISGAIELGGGTNAISNLAGGVIETESVTGDNITFDNAGVFSVGDTGVAASSAAVTADDFNQSSTGSLLFEIDATGAHDTLAIDGLVTLDGLVRLSIDSNAAFAAGTTFDVLSSSTPITLEQTLAFEAVVQALSPDDELLTLADVTDLFALNLLDPFTLQVTALEDFDFDFPLLAGDYNADGVVDAADYTVWRDNLGEPAGTLVNDTDGGVIGTAQYDTWVTNFGQTLPSSAVTVPEPLGIGLLISGLLTGAGVCRRSRAA